MGLSMNNLGQIGILGFEGYRESRLEVYSSSGSLSIDSVPASSNLKVYAHSVGHIQDVKSNEDGSFEIYNLPLDDITVVGYDKYHMRQSEAKTVRPNKIQFSRVSQLGWDESTKGPNITVNNQKISNLTANNQTENIISTNKHEHGKFFAELLVENVTGGATPSRVGIGHITALSSELGSGLDSVAWLSNGTVIHNNTVVDTISDWQTNDILTILYFRGQVWFIRERNGERVYHGNVLDVSNPVVSMNTGYTVGICVNPYMNGDSFTMRALAGSTRQLYKNFLPWDTVEGVI